MIKIYMIIPWGAEYVMCAVQGNVTVDVRASYSKPIMRRQPENFMHDMVIYLCNTIFTFHMHLALRHVQSMHG